MSSRQHLASSLIARLVAQEGRLCVDGFGADDLQQLVLPPRLVTFELKFLGVLALPPLSDTTLKRLVWLELGASPHLSRPLPSSRSQRTDANREDTRCRPPQVKIF